MKVAVEGAPAESKDKTGGRRAAARTAYRASLAEGVPLTGAELGRRFGLSPRRGRLRVAEVHAEAVAGNGTRPARDLPGDAPDDGPALSEAGAHEYGRRAEAASARTDGSSQRAGLRTGSELLSAVDPAAAVTPVVRGITALAVLAVALVAAVASYDHQRALAALAGEDWRAWLLPVSVDGLIVAASMSMLVQRRAGMPAGALAWASLLAGIGASLAANVAAAEPTMVGRVVAACPPVALLLARELLMQVRAPSPGGHA